MLCVRSLLCITHFFLHSLALGWPSTQACAYAPGFKSRSAQGHLSSNRTSSWAGYVLGFWWFPLNQLHMHSSMWSKAEALSEYGVVPELCIYDYSRLKLFALTRRCHVI
jgi:hypothetical protein